MSHPSAWQGFLPNRVVDCSHLLCCSCARLQGTGMCALPVSLTGLKQLWTVEGFDLCRLVGLDSLTWATYWPGSWTVLVHIHTCHMVNAPSWACRRGS